MEELSETADAERKTNTGREAKSHTHKRRSSEQVSWQFQVNHSTPEANIRCLEPPYKHKFHVVIPN